MTDDKLGIDWSFDTIPAINVKNAGYQVAVHYLGGTANKRWSKSLIAEYQGCGLGIMPVYEDGEQDALKGYAEGVQHGKNATAQLKALGWPENKVCCYAIDFDTNATQIDTLVQYAKGCVAGSTYPVGIYGSILTIEALHPYVSYLWQTEAWSGTRVSPVAHLYQRVKPTKTIAHNPKYDEDVVLKDVPVGFWYPTVPKPTPKPTTGETDMHYCEFTNGLVLMTNFINYRVLTTTDQKNVAKFLTAATNKQYVHEGMDVNLLKDMSTFGIEVK